jgi:hypothetical protein
MSDAAPVGCDLSEEPILETPWQKRLGHRHLLVLVTKARTGIDDDGCRKVATQYVTTNSPCLTTTRTDPQDGLAKASPIYSVHVHLNGFTVVLRLPTSEWSFFL